MGIKNLIQAAVSFCLMTIVFGCGPAQMQFGIAPDSQQFKQNGGIFNNQLDVLWVIDNSGSMDPYQANLTSNFESFISNFRDRQYDMHIAVASSDAYLANSKQFNDPAWAKFRDGSDDTGHSGIFMITSATPDMSSVFVTNAHLGIKGSGDERTFSSFREALNSPLNAGFLRRHSFLAIVILSDEDDFSGNDRPQQGNEWDYDASTLESVDSYVKYLDTLTQTTGGTRRYNVSAITVPDQNCRDQHPNSIIGKRHMQLVKKTKGVVGNICDASYANALNAIQLNIAELSTQFYLDREPQVKTIKVIVNGVEIPKDETQGWTYERDANAIRFHGDAIPPQNSLIDVSFVPTGMKG